MRKLVLILSTLLISAYGAYAGVISDRHLEERRYTIKEDTGGVVSDFEINIKFLETKNIQIKLDGVCASSCTLLLSHPKIDMCVTYKAVMQIHEPFLMGESGDVVYSINGIVNGITLWQTVFWNDYPEWVKEYINERGSYVPSVYVTGKTTDTMDIPYTILKDHYSTCE